MAESYSVQAVLSAKDDGFTSTFKNAMSATESLGSKVKSGLGFGVLAGIGQQAFSTITNGVSGLISELDSSNSAWKVFTKNMEMTGSSASEISNIKGELQDFAQKTIYSASDMASTYSQLAAVGTKNTTALVKGFGGLAAAAIEPKQAMKTLSQQATQMAAKPMVQWQDFKLMMEQTPAGVASVAKQMNMSASELVASVQDGKIATEDFFDAVAKVGTNDSFTQLATQYKTVGEAMDGLVETVSNNVQPAFDELSQVGINAVSSITNALEQIDVSSITAKVHPLADALNSIVDAFANSGLSGGISEIVSQFSQANDSVKGFASVIGTAFVATNLDGLINGFKLLKGSMSQIGSSKTFQGITSQLPKMASSMKSVGGIAKGTLVGGFKQLGSAISTASPALQQFGGAMVESIQPAKRAFTGMLETVSPALQSVTGVITGFAPQVASAFGTFSSVALKALFPAAIVATALAGLGVLYTQFGEQINQMLAVAQTKGPEIITNLVNGITAQLPTLIAKGAELVSNLMNTITANLPAIISGGAQIITSLVSGLASQAPQLVTSALSMIGQFVVGIAGALPSVIASGMQLLGSLAQGIAQNLPTIIQSAVQALTSFVMGISQNLPTIIQSAMQIIVSLAQGLITAIPTLIAAVPQIVTALVQAILSTDWVGVGKNIVSSIGEGLKGIASWVTGGKEGGKQTSSGVASGIASGQEQVNTAASNVSSGVTTTLSTGASGASKAGTQTMSAYSSAVSSGASGASDAVASATTSMTNSLNDTATTAKTAGTETGTKYTQGLKSSVSKATSVASQMTKAVGTKLRSGYASAYTSGSYISQGFARGMESCLGRIQAAAAKMVAAADKAIKAKGQIHSPSKLTAKSGKYLAQGLAVGMVQGITDITNASKRLISAATSAMKGATVTRDYTGAADSATSAYKSALESKKNSISKTASSTVDAAIKSATKKTKNKTLKKNLKTVGTTLKNQMTKYIEQASNKAIEAAESAMNALAEVYQDKYNEIANDRSAYLSKLQDYGSLYSVDSYGFITFTDFSEQTKKVKQLESNLEKLKDVLPYDLMMDIQQLDTTAGLQYTNELLKKSGEYLTNYGNQYTEMMNTAQNASQSYYKSYVDKLDNEYNAAITTEMQKLEAQLNTIGQQAAQGLINGLSSESVTKQLKKVAKNLANTLVKTFKKKLGIHSPSRVFMGLAEYIGAGVVKGVDSMQRDVSAAMNNLLTVPDVSIPALAGGFSGELSSDYDYYRNANYTIYTTVEMDGREVAKATAPYTEEELNKRQTRSNRRSGIR